MLIKNYIQKVFWAMLKSLTPQIRVYPQVSQLSPSNLLLGRTALVTGGTSGIGYAIAKAFIDAGASVIITGRDMDRIDKAINNLSADTAGGKVYGLQLDNREIDKFAQKIEEAKAMIGKREIDILVNNAGVLGCKFGNGKEEDYDNVMDTNLKGVFFLSQIVGHYMKDNNIQGNILNVGSSSCLRPASSAYTISKWGLRGLTMGMAKSLAPYGIVVNGIAPGPTATPMLRKDNLGGDLYFNNPSGRYALPEEIAGMAVVLVSNISRMVIGDIVFMTGGSGVITYDDVNYKFD